MIRHLLIAIAATITFAPGASAQEPSAQVKSAAFLETVAARGVECGLLRPWQATAIRALNHSDMERWAETHRADLLTEIDRRNTEIDCGNEAMRLWIDGASRGFDTEMLPPYLVVYRRIAQLKNPPKSFSAVALRVDYGLAIDAIDRKLADLEASGAVPEGGKPWPDYIAHTEKFADEFVATLNSPTAADADQAAAWLAQSALIVEQWLADSAAKN